MPDFPPIVIAEDDEDDYLLVMEALKEAKVKTHLEWVKDGEELLEYLNGLKGDESSPFPSLVLLDLNMPRKDGREALSEIKASNKLRQIPVIILTTSRAEADVVHSYELGVNSFIQKPVRFNDFVDMVNTLTHYWFKTVKLPA